jgi:hypothetical protein
MDPFSSSFETGRTERHELIKMHFEIESEQKDIASSVVHFEARSNIRSYCGFLSRNKTQPCYVYMIVLRDMGSRFGYFRERARERRRKTCGCLVLF